MMYVYGHLRDFFMRKRRTDRKVRARGRDVRSSLWR